MMGLVHDILNEFERLFDAIRGKWSYEVWMDMIGRFTDELVMKTESDKTLEYDHGLCFVRYDGNDAVEVKLRLYFTGSEKKVTRFDANRFFALEKFTHEAVEKIKSDGCVSFEIDSPELERGGNL